MAHYVPAVARWHVEKSERLLEEAANPPVMVTGLDPNEPIPEWTADTVGHMIVEVDGMKVDRSGIFLAAQTHAILAVAAELSEANRIARIVGNVGLDQ